VFAAAGAGALASRTIARDCAVLLVVVDVLRLPELPALQPVASRCPPASPGLRRGSFAKSAPRPAPLQWPAERSSV
jgi:hypothetical protein